MGQNDTFKSQYSKAKTKRIAPNTGNIYHESDIYLDFYVVLGMEISEVIISFAGIKLVSIWLKYKYDKEKTRRKKKKKKERKAILYWWTQFIIISKHIPTDIYAYQRAYRD